MLRKINDLKSTIRTHWRPIFIENPGAAIGGIVAIVCAFSADYFASIFGGNIFTIMGYAFHFDAYLLGLFLYVGIYLIGVFYETRKFIFYNRRRLHLPTVVNIANPVNAQDALKIFVQALAEKLRVSEKYLDELERYLMITRDDLILSYVINIHNPGQLYDMLAVIRHNLTRLQKQTPRDHILELVYIGPVAIALWLGAVTHTESIALWPHSRGTEDSYPERVGVSDHLRVALAPGVVRRTQGVVMGDVLEGSKGGRWLVALDLSGVPKLSNYQDYFEDIDCCFYVRGVEDSVRIGADEYIQYAQEVCQYITDLNAGYAPRVMRLVCCVPIVLAILIGRYLGTLLPVEVAHFISEERRYIVLFNLNDARFRYQHIS